MATTLTPILSAFWDDPKSWSLETYTRHNGYKALDKALAMEPAAIIAAVKDSSLRGRGGAGFPTGMKWSFMAPPDGGPRYLVVNADESEPGTCKDIPLMMANPHVLIEGVAISSFAIGCEHAFIYLRGEVVHVYRRLLRAVEEAYAAGHLGKNVHGTGVNLDITVHAGAGAYICGEETALLDSLEGRRGQPRSKPPFPGAAGLYARPTSVNNVESIASVPGIILEGVDWFTGMGTEKSTGFGIFSLSGHVKTPGQYEAPLGITLRELIDMAGGMRDPDKALKFWTPGGSSTPLFTAEHLDVPLDFESVGAAGSMLGAERIDRQRQCQRRVDATGQPQHHTLEAILVDVITHPGDQRLVDQRPIPGLRLLQTLLEQYPTRRIATDTHRKQTFGKVRRQHCKPAVAPDRHGTPVEHQLILAADLVHIEDGDIAGQRAALDDPQSLAVLAEVIGGGIDVEQYFSASLDRHRGRTLVPDVFAHRQREPESTDLDHTGLHSRDEIALLVEYLVVRQLHLPVGSHQLATLEQARHVLQATRAARRIAEQHPHIRQLPPQTLERALDAKPDAGAQQQVFGRITSEREFRENHHIGPVQLHGTPALRKDETGVALDVSHQWIDLGHHNRDLRHRQTHPE